MGTLFTLGILIAGSDGAWFPWVNFGGIGLLAMMLGFEKILSSRARHRGANIEDLPLMTRPLRTRKVAAPISRELANRGTII